MIIPLQTECLSTRQGKRWTDPLYVVTWTQSTTGKRRRLCERGAAMTPPCPQEKPTANAGGGILCLLKWRRRFNTPPFLPQAQPRWGRIRQPQGPQSGPARLDLARQMPCALPLFIAQAKACDLSGSLILQEPDRSPPPENAVWVKSASAASAGFLAGSSSAGTS